MAKRLFLSIALIAASALICWIASPSNRHPGRSENLRALQIASYPNTGFPSVLPSAPGAAARIAASMQEQLGFRVAATEFQDTIDPEEDLLLDGRLPPPAGVESAPTASEPMTLAPRGRPAPRRQDRLLPPRIAQPDEPNAAPNTEAPSGNPVPATNPSGIERDRAMPDEDLLQPQTAPQALPPFEEERPEQPPPTMRQLPPPDPASAPNRSRGYDPHGSPSPDEDLLLAPPANLRDAPGRGGSPNAVELLPQRPRLQEPPISRPLTPPSYAPNSQIPQRQGGPFAPQAPVRTPLAPHQSPDSLRSLGPPNSPPVANRPETKTDTESDPHADLFVESSYPSARQCRACHEQIYDEWASSSHAYAAISPMFHSFEQTISQLTRGTIGYFCMRCHSPVGTTLSLPREQSILEAPLVAREGVTCVACHRVREQYGKANGERRIEPGDIHDPVYGSGYGEGLRKVLNERASYKVKPFPSKGPGQAIHREVIHFDQISDSSFCVSCHQVAVAPGIKLEVVWEQYRASPACRQGISCQDCHMGSEPGVPSGYETGPVAVVNNKPVSPERKHSNHTFYGPGYSIAHPGIFPANPDADDWTPQEWIQFDYRAGWGTEAFEDALDAGHIRATFPPVWENADDRSDARDVIDANLAKLRKKKAIRTRLMENATHIDGPFFDSKSRVHRPLKFHYIVTNMGTGHNLPSGSLGAQPQLWVNVALTGPNGQRLWESGYVDSNGDIADLHSIDVAAGRVPRDLQLVNFQTKFLITGAKGTDREVYLPVNVDFDQLPFIRPSAFPITVMNHPPFIRMEAHSIPPLGTRKAEYRVPARLLQRPGRYRLSIRMRSRAEPIYFMRYCNATPEMERTMNEWMVDFHEHATEFWVE